MRTPFRGRSLWATLFKVIFVAAVVWLACLPAVAQDIPTGTTLERYSRLWERNPFAPEKENRPVARHSILDELVLSSWLRGNFGDIVLAKNLATNEITKIEASPNKSNLRLLKLTVNSDPRLVEAVISDKDETRVIKFAFGGQASSELANSQVAGPSGVDSPNRTTAPELANAQSPQAPETTAKLMAGQPYRIYPGQPRVHHEGGMPETAQTVKTAAHVLPPDALSAGTHSD